MPQGHTRTVAHDSYAPGALEPRSRGLNEVPSSSPQALSDSRSAHGITMLLLARLIVAEHSQDRPVIVVPGGTTAYGEAGADLQGVVGRAGRRVRVPAAPWNPGCRVRTHAPPPLACRRATGQSRWASALPSHTTSRPRLPDSSALVSAVPRCPNASPLMKTRSRPAVRAMSTVRYQPTVAVRRTVGAFSNRRPRPARDPGGLRRHRPRETPPDEHATIAVRIGARGRVVCPSGRARPADAARVGRGGPTSARRTRPGRSRGQRRRRDRRQTTGVGGPGHHGRSGAGRGGRGRTGRPGRGRCGGRVPQRSPAPPPGPTPSVCRSSARPRCSTRSPRSRRSGSRAWPRPSTAAGGSISKVRRAAGGGDVFVSPYDRRQGRQRRSGSRDGN